MNRMRNVLIPALCLLPLLTGCHISRPAAPDRRATAPLPGPEAWPSRDIEAVRDFHERTPEVIRSWELNGLVAEDQLDERSRKALASIEQTVIANRLTDHGLLRVWSDPEGDRDRFTANWLFGGGFVENAAFLSSRDASGYRRERALKDVPDALGTPRLKKNFWLPGLQQTYSGESVMLGRGIDLRVPTRVRGRGVLVVLGGLFSTTWQESSIELFEKAGWDVLQIDPVSWTRKPNDDNYEAVQDQRGAFAKDLFERRLGWKNEDGSYVPMSERADDDASAQDHLDIYAAAYD